MAYRQKVTNPDIRNITLKDLPKAEAPVVEKSDVPASEPAFSAHHPGADVRRIAFAAAPLIVILLIASYLDVTRHWVVPFAQWLMRLGS